MYIYGKHTTWFVRGMGKNNESKTEKNKDRKNKEQDMRMPMFTRPTRTVEEERELFEPIYSVEMVRKWKLDRLKTIIDERKKGIKFGDIHYDNSHHFTDGDYDYRMCTEWRHETKN